MIAIEPTRNPFSASRVRPGAIPFLFVGDRAHESLEQLIARFWTDGGRGQIVGAHGSGKSTLLRSMLAAFEQQGHATALVELRSDDRRLGPLPKLANTNDRRAVIAIDGFEQLGPFGAWRVARWCKQRAHALLVTTHVPRRLPTLYETRPTLALVQEIAGQLLGDHRNLTGPGDVEHALARHPGDVRETLFRLYDVYEARRRSR